MGQHIEMTSDGSHTVYSEQFQANYHSTHGSIQESKTVFLENGLMHSQLDSIDVLEIGFGTGLNAALTFDFVQSHSKKVNYMGIEKYPISMELVSELNYHTFFTHAQTQKGLIHLHQTRQLDWHEQQSSFHAKVQIEDVHEINFSDAFDVIYFDAFAPQSKKVFGKFLS